MLHLQFHKHRQTLYAWLWRYPQLYPSSVSAGRPFPSRRDLSTVPPTQHYLQPSQCNAFVQPTHNSHTSLQTSQHTATSCEESSVSSKKYMCCNSWKKFNSEKQKQDIVWKITIMTTKPLVNAVQVDGKNNADKWRSRWKWEKKILLMNGACHFDEIDFELWKQECYLADE